MEEKILEVRDLKTYFFTNVGVIRAVDGVSFSLGQGRTLGIVGESGSGKSVTALSIMGLIPKPAGKIVGGEILYRAEDLVRKSNQEMRDFRGKKIFMIPQDPMTSLNPVFTIGGQIGEALQQHQGVNGDALKRKILEMLRLVRIPMPEKRIETYPHQLSGGMKQRVMISMALSCQPEVLIADEPTTALDVTIQAQIFRLLVEIRQKYHSSIILITHDLGIIAKFCDEVAVMYAGRIVEKADVISLFKRHRHPYTKGLIHSVPLINIRKERLWVIKGQPPNLIDLPEGCPFEPRCDEAIEKCKKDYPPTEFVTDHHTICCWRWKER